MKDDLHTTSDGGRRGRRTIGHTHTEGKEKKEQESLAKVLETNRPEDAEAEIICTCDYIGCIPDLVGPVSPPFLARFSPLAALSYLV